MEGQRFEVVLIFSTTDYQCRADAVVQTSAELEWFCFSNSASNIKMQLRAILLFADQMSQLPKKGK